jgi:hypothetical protein
MEGFYNGYRATHDSRYVDMAVDWADSLIKRAVMEPDGYLGWPGQWGRTKIINAGSGVDNLNEYNTDSFISDAMVFRPIVLMAREMTRNPALKEKYGAKGESYLKLAGQLYEKWVKRGGWREIEDGGMISVILPFGMDEANQKWIGFDTRNDPGHGFSHPDNQANEVARWMLAMWDVTGRPEFKERAERWFKVQKSRMKPMDDGTYEIWNYWQPAGPWDYKPDGSTKHWVGVHPNGGYYECDLGGIVDAYEHGLVFTKEDIARLIATNRDFMWNHQVEHAKFQRIDGEAPDPHYADSPGVLWDALAPYDPTLWKIFVANYNPGSWGGMGAPEWVARFGPKSKAGR